ERSARRLTDNGPVISHAGFSVLPEEPSPDSLLVTAIIRGVTTPQLSLAFALTVTGTIAWSGGQSTLGLALTPVTTGASVALTVTGKLQLDSLPAASVAVQETVVVPRGKTEPDGGLQMAMSPEQSSAT